MTVRFLLGGYRGLTLWILFLSNTMFSSVQAFVASSGRGGLRRQTLASQAASTNDLPDFNNSKEQPTVRVNELKSIDRIYCLSDLHTDHVSNLEWVSDHCQSLSTRDLLVVAGDISHKSDRLRETFDAIRSNTDCQIFFVPGNHEAWIDTSSNNEDDDIEDSFAKLAGVLDTCRECGVLVDATRVDGDQPVWIVPLQSWYDGSLSLPNCRDLCTDFPRWPWTDFARCRWTGHEPMGGDNGRIPQGVTQHFHQQNQATIDTVNQRRRSKRTRRRQWRRLPLLRRQAEEEEDGGQEEPVMTVSHFLPNRQSLPDWKDLSVRSFQRDEWLDHGAPGTSAKFAKVAGSLSLDQQIRSLGATIHVFGHSHRPKDFVLDGVRYVHNPLGYGRERDMYMVSPKVDLKPVWDTRTGHVPGEQVLRLWEEQGGGVEALHARMEARRGGGRRRGRRLL